MSDAKSAYVAITIGVAVPNQPAKSRLGETLRSCVVMYQNVRKATMNVFRIRADDAEGRRCGGREDDIRSFSNLRGSRAIPG